MQSQSVPYQACCQPMPGLFCAVFVCLSCTTWIVKSCKDSAIVLSCKGVTFKGSGKFSCWKLLNFASCVWTEVFALLTYPASRLKLFHVIVSEWPGEPSHLGYIDHTVYTGKDGMFLLISIKSKAKRGLTWRKATRTLRGNKSPIQSFCLIFQATGYSLWMQYSQARLPVSLSSPCPFCKLQKQLWKKKYLSTNLYTLCGTVVWVYLYSMIGRVPSALLWQNCENSAFMCFHF